MTSPSKPCDRCKGRGEVDYGPYEDIQMIPCPQCKGQRTHFSLEEVHALPVGGGFGLEQRVIDGKTVNVPTMRRDVCFFVDDTTPLMWMDSEGSRWRLGRYADGTWFKKRVEW